MTDENIKMTREGLISLENKIRINLETIEDYEKLESFFFRSGFPENYVLSTLTKEGVFSFQELELFRKHPPEPRNPTREGRVAGILLGLISYLKDKL